jgi:hypothetical protein
MHEHSERLAKMAYHLCGRIPDDNYGDLRDAIADTLHKAECNGKKAACTHRDEGMQSTIVDAVIGSVRIFAPSETCHCSKCGEEFCYNPHDW